MHDDEPARASRHGDGIREPWIALRAAAKLDHTRGKARRDRQEVGRWSLACLAPGCVSVPDHATNPRHSSSSSIRFAFCTACPAAPFTRLSIAEKSWRVGVRTFAAQRAYMRTTLR